MLACTAFLTSTTSSASDVSQAAGYRPKVIFLTIRAFLGSQIAQMGISYGQYRNIHVGWLWNHV